MLVAQGFNLAGYAPHLALVALWFNRRRGVASGVMIGGASLGSLVVVPGIQYLVDQYGWRLAYTVLGGENTGTGYEFYCGRHAIQQCDD